MSAPETTPGRAMLVRIAVPSGGGTVQGTVPPPDRTGRLYDSRRDVYYVKPLLRGWLHALWFAASLLFGGILISRANGWVAVLAASVYASSVSALFATSALYHRGTWTPGWSRRLQRLDHAMIFFLIAGSATPGFLLATDGALRLVCLVSLWTLTVAAGTVHLVWMHAPERLVGSVFIGIGIIAGLSVPAIWRHGGVAAALLVVVGGLLYIAGALCYHRRRPDPIPHIFGYHEVFHTYVCAAATCHYLAIARLF